MDILSTIGDLSPVGLESSKIKHAEIIHQKHGHCLYRITHASQPFILKWFKNSTTATEVRCYELLEKLGVSTLPVHGHTSNALLLEDLATSSTWRMAIEDDMDCAETGEAVAVWYFTLHEAGREFLRETERVPDFLGRESDALSPESIEETGRKLDLVDHPVWSLAAAHIEWLKEAMQALSETFTYNDFYWGNLALSREEPKVRAIVYDYHMMGVGLPYSDCRNVVGSLGNRAVDAFWSTYGSTDEREKRLDEATSPLYALVVASQRRSFPQWAQESLNMVRSDEMERRIQRALEVR